MTLRTISFLAITILPGWRALPQGSKQNKACNEAMTFCWYADDVTAQGNRWVNQDPKQNIEVGITIRCVKSLNVCIRARTYKQALNKNLTVTGIELMPITHWDAQQIRANAEDYDWEPCDRDSFIINRLDRSVLMISSPGPKADTSACTGILGKPRTVTYKLSQ
jgi:hypothetical protein